MGTPAWLDDAVFYEIYPQSFQDTNGDGIGDLPGIIDRLDYIKSLNVNALWLNPCFVSPFMDAGYDVADFYRIAPRYGTNDDMKRLCEEAHARGIRVILDLVAGHTSIEHPWFKASASAEKTPYDDYFVWTDGWGEKTGDYRFISGMEPRNGYFMINFFACQPALNYGFKKPDPTMPWQKSSDDPAVRRVWEETKNIMKFWLDLGCDGFRVDMAPSLVKGDPDGEGIREIWHYYRSWLDENYPEAVLISEWSCPPKAIDAGFHIDFMIHFGQEGFRDLFLKENCFFNRNGKGDASRFIEELTGNLAHIGDRGFVAVPTANHDMSRIRGRRSLADLRLTHTFLMLLPGVPFVYYGDEIGMANVAGLGNKEGSYSRSECRTPMQWAPGEKAGFSTAEPEKFYLPLDPDPGRPDVETQEKDPESLLAFTRKLIALRRANPALRSRGGFRCLYCSKGKSPLVYERFLGDERWVVAVNPEEKENSVEFALPGADRFRQVIDCGGAVLAAAPGAALLRMPPCSCAVWSNR